MVFSSIVFLFYFMVPVLVIYRLMPSKGKNLFLFIASLVFYAWGEPKYVLLMLFSAVFNYESGLFIDKTEKKKLAIIINVIVNIGILIYFKYTNFVLSWVGAFFPEGAPMLDIVLPVGISFYTFQALSYTVDVYRGKTEVQKSFLAFGLYLSLFPQLIAGPIVRYNDVAKQLKERNHSGTMFMDGMTRFCVGLCKKVIIANNVGNLWNNISAYDFTGISSGLAWMGIIAYTLQIYFDFSGYSDMAIGLGKMFGFDFLENFDYPYISKSITEFWRRWHMSLSSWFREYVYIPMGGNRVGKFRMYINILTVWMLTGLWHGASWNFVLWGLYYALILVIEKAFLKKVLDKIGPIAHVYTMVLVIVGWALFSLEGLPDVISYVRAMFNFHYLGLDEGNFLYNLTSYAGVLIIAILAATGIPKKLYDKFMPEKLYFVKYVLAAAGFILCTAYLVDETFNPFLYFRF
ncbi:MAG: MBOAT family protein [Oscillospiraceae bacterium]|nr:MBOAT family protein [Oscillospiraceae bacterium]